MRKLRTPGLIVGAALVAAALAPSSGQAVSARAAACSPVKNVEAIIDDSGSMTGSDSNRLRVQAMDLLINALPDGTQLGAIQFGSSFDPATPSASVVFPVEPIGPNAAAMKSALDTQIQADDGGTDYNAAFDTGRSANPGAGARIFLTDGGHNSGPYNNGHLRFAINSSGHSWPVCVVQLGTAFQQADVDRLKRIAQETGGQYVATPTDDQLAGLYFSCLGLTTGQKTVVNKVFTFKKGQTKTVKRRLPKKKLPSVTFFFNHGGGNYDIKLRDPRGKIHTPKRPGRGASFGKGATYAFYRIRRPDGGVWRMIVKALQLPATTDKGNVKITITPGK